jgi:diguanylate cyclase (GGDEF)-like protein
MGLVGALDHLSGSELSFSIFYLFPVGLVALYGALEASVLFSVASALVWALLDDPLAPYSHWAIGYWNAFVRFGFFVIVALTLHRLRALAATDPLTGVANSRSFYAALEREVARMARTGKPLVVAYLDVDDFKRVNDGAGHLAGDELLRSLSTALTRNLRAVDFVARLGGDEFAVLFPETDGEAARSLLERVRAALGDAVRAFPRVSTVTCSAGAVVVTSPPRDVEELVHAADSLMYRVKRSGKNALLVETLRGPGGES